MPHTHDPSRPIDIRKSAGVLICDHRLLVTRSHGKDFFMSPGGKIDDGETPVECLMRELHEELGITTDEKISKTSAPTTPWRVASMTNSSRCESS